MGCRRGLAANDTTANPKFSKGRPAAITAVNCGCASETAETVGSQPPEDFGPPVLGGCNYQNSGLVSN